MPRLSRRIIGWGVRYEALHGVSSYLPDGFAMVPLDRSSTIALQPMKLSNSWVFHRRKLIIS